MTLDWLLKIEAEIFGKGPKLGTQGPPIKRNTVFHLRDAGNQTNIAEI